MSDVRLLRGFPRQAADRADRHRRIFQGRSFAGKIHQRLPELLHAEFGRRHARRRQLRHHRGETDVELPLPTRLELLAARRLEQQHMELRLLHQHLPRTDARSAGRERSGLRPLRGYGALLAGMELFRTGEDLRRSALVRPRRPLRQRGRPLQAPRQPRIRHGARARRPQLRLRTLLPRRHGSTTRRSTATSHWPSSRASASSREPTANTTASIRRRARRGIPNTTRTTNGCARRPMPAKS